MDGSTSLWSRSFGSGTLRVAVIWVGDITVAVILVVVISGGVILVR